MKDVELIEKLGGTVAVSTALNLDHTTVSKWKKLGISAAGRYQIKELAASRGIELPANFIRKPNQRKKGNGRKSRKSRQRKEVPVQS